MILLHRNVSVMNTIYLDLHADCGEDFLLLVVLFRYVLKKKMNPDVCPGPAADNLPVT